MSLEQENQQQNNMHSDISADSPMVGLAESLFPRVRISGRCWLRSGSNTVGRPLGTAHGLHSEAIVADVDKFGRQALKAKMLELGYDIDGKELDDLFSRFKGVAGNKKPSVFVFCMNHSLQAALASMISNLASKVSNKVKSKMRTSEDYSDHEGGSNDSSHHSDPGFPDTLMSNHKDDAASSTPRGDIHLSLFGLFSSASHKDNSPSDESELKPGISKIITKAEALIGNKNLVWPWKGYERDGMTDTKSSHFMSPWLNNDQENELCQQKSGPKSENLVNESNRTANIEGALGPWSSSVNVNSTCTAGSSCGSTSSSAVNKADAVTDCLDYEILWEYLTVAEQIGQGSCGTVYHSLWYGSDVAVKIFSKQEYSDYLIFSFRQE
ncbi:hypothetical protein CASFOL_009217 [Castilleja foliolosa]|uniref:Protein kinase domain-containing protein n=1 Tax=Castilleja foliolosa TaxID=1961234 RepID=A0ABD3DWM5_9LAMI